jgi:hypothetical protein
VPDRELALFDQLLLPGDEHDEAATTSSSNRMTGDANKVTCEERFVGTGHGELSPVEASRQSRINRLCHVKTVTASSRKSTSSVPTMPARIAIPFPPSWRWSVFARANDASPRSPRMPE